MRGAIGGTEWYAHERFRGITMRTFFIMTIVLLLSACGGVNQGRKIDTNQVSKFQTGKTTYEQVIATMGTPASIQNHSDGTRVLIYVHTQAAPRPATFVPVVGLFAGGADVQQQSVIFTFDRDGVLKDYTTQDTQMCS